ncbi:MAG TPA: nicotinamide riboside transporter PnuC [Actinomycetota bacterium]|nr:nicotinamide riboside transporter PnuC [Actinomycetota bacterium]
MSLTEVLGFVTGAASVWLAARDNVWNWPIGIANSLFFLFLFFTAGLYANSGLQIFYIVIGFYGWYAWLRGGEAKTQLDISRTPRRALPYLVTAGLIGTIILTSALDRLAGSTAPLWDGLTTALSLVAQYMLARKWLENWWVWISADVIYIVLYANTGLLLTSFLYGIFLMMCVVGYRHWKKTWTATSQSVLEAGPAVGP